MFLRSVHIRNFRNLKDVNLDLSGGNAAFVGLNGAGKTNIIEAIYFGLKGRPFRPFVQKSDLFRSGSAEKTSVAMFLNQEGGRNSEVQALGNPETNRFSFQVNDKKLPLGDFIFRFPVVAFSPQDHELIRGGPEARRDFLDQVYSDICPGYYEVLSNFQRALKQRNSLLKAVQAETGVSVHEIRSWNEVFVETSVAVKELRAESWPEFAESFRVLLKSLNLGFGPEVLMEWKTNVGSREEIHTLLEENLQKDIATGWTHAGPHRDDIEIKLQGQPVKSAASQGQGRLLGLLLRWTHAFWIQRMRQEKALFLLDDFSSELDGRHREQLLESLLEHSHQLLWTGTTVESHSLHKIATNNLKLFKVFNGEVGEENLINPSASRVVDSSQHLLS